MKLSNFFLSESKSLLGDVKPNIKKPKRPNIEISKLTKDMENMELDEKNKEAVFPMTSETLEHRDNDVSEQRTREK